MTRYRIEAAVEDESLAKELRRMMNELDGCTVTAFDPELTEPEDN